MFLIEHQLDLAARGDAIDEAARQRMVQSLDVQFHNAPAAACSGPSNSTMAGEIFSTRPGTV